VAPLEVDAGSELCATVLGLVERGWDAQLVVDAGENGARARPRALDALARKRRLHVSGVPRRSRRRRTLEQLLHALDPGVVHFLRADHALSELPVAANGASRVVATFSAVDVSVAGLEVPAYYDDLWARIDLLHFPDSAVLSRAERRGLPEGKARAVIPPFVDFTSYRPDRRAPAAERPLRVLCAGRLEWAGGYEHALHGLALAAERGVVCECRVVGEGPHLAALLYARLQLGLSERVTFEGGATAAVLAAHLAWADVFLAPTVIDGLPDHVVEAAAMELCLVLANPGPLGDLKLDESVAVTVPRRDPDALAEALVTVAGDPAARLAMGSAARAWALERFPLDEHLDRLAETYRQVLA
jgi:glycosyltransferase involved in cell wall biosynthesis